MFARQYCHNLLRSSFKDINKARIKTLLQCSDGLINADQMTLTAIGRHLSGPGMTKHKIKRVDRFLSNPKVLNDTLNIYHQLFRQFVPKLPFYTIAVDWSGCCGSEYWLLRASLLVDGRSIVLFNKVVLEKDLEQPHIHDEFLESLATFFNDDERVYIVADGGFKTPWMHKVEALGWYHVTRIRGNIHSSVEDNVWQPISALFKGANSIPKALGIGKLGKTSKTQRDVYLHLYKGKLKGRRSTGHKYPDKEKMYKSIAHEPWLLATNAPNLTAKEAVAIYARRMQIEQNFRDDKSPRYGFSWRHSKTTSVHRISILCLIATVATNVLWFIGFQAERKKLHHQFQANSVKTRRVLSFLSLAKNILNHFTYRRIMSLFNQGRKTLAKEYEKCIYTWAL